MSVSVDYIAAQKQPAKRQEWLANPANKPIIDAYLSLPDGQNLLTMLLGGDNANGTLATAVFNNAGGNPALLKQTLNSMPRDSGGLLNSLGSFIKSASPIIKAAAIVSGIGGLANLAAGTSMFGGGSAAAGTGAGAGLAEGGGLTAAQAAGTAAMGSGYAAPAIATASGAAAGANTLAGLAGGTPAAGGAGGAGGAVGTGGIGSAPAWYTPEVAAGTAPGMYAGTGGAVAGGASSLIPGVANNTLGSLASGGASLLGANMASNSAKDAAAIQAQSGQAAIDEAKRQFDIGQANQKPWMTAGQSALGGQLDLMGLPGGTTGSSTNALAELQKTPGYQFRLDQGNQAINRSAAAKGMLNSGNVLADLTNYGQGAASTEYGNRLNQLGSLSGTGQAAASGMANQGANYANQYGNNVTGIGNANAAGTVASGNAWQSGILGAGQSLSNFFNPPQQQPTFKMVNGQWSYS